MNNKYSENLGVGYQHFHEFNKKDKDKIAEVIETKHAIHWLSPTVDNWIYGTTRALDFGDYYGTLNKKALWEHAVNKNSDLFIYDELIDIHPEKNIQRYQTFKTAALYRDHKSSSLEFAIGLLFDSVILKDKYDDMHVTTLFGLDPTKAPGIARVLEDYPTRVSTSMGCSIKYSICTACGKEIKSDDEFCDHLIYNRGGRANGKKVAELLKGVDFYELSIVNAPACPTAFVIDAVSKIVPGRLLKVAKSEEGLEVARVMSTVYSMIKEAGTSNEKKRLANQLEMLIGKLQELEAKRIA